ncbi:MAG: spore coat protein GerQ [Sporolactobacillus sp.]
MSEQYPPENWPYGASFGADPDQANGAQRQASQPTGQPQTGSASSPFSSQFTQPVGSPAVPPLPYMYPPYTTTPPGTAAPTVPAQMPMQPVAPTAIPLPLVEQSYIENILRLNLGKTATVYCTFEGNSEWNAKSFTGTVEAAGRDHVIIKDSGSETRYLIPMVFVNYFTFTGPMSYSYPYAPPVSR